MAGVRLCFFSKSFSLSEPNVLVLDMPGFRIGGKNLPWEPAEEILRRDDRLRERF